GGSPGGSPGGVEQPGRGLTAGRARAAVGARVVLFAPGPPREEIAPLALAVSLPQRGRLLAPGPGRRGGCVPCRPGSGLGGKGHRRRGGRRVGRRRGPAGRLAYDATRALIRRGRGRGGGLGLVRLP